MPVVIFEDEEKSVEVEAGTSIQDANDKADANIPFGCTQGECGTCLIEVLSGMENLTPITEDEDMTLSAEEKAANYRLACQCKITGGEIKIQPTDEIF